MPRNSRKPSAGSTKAARATERAAEKAIMRANGMTESRYQQLVKKYTHAGLWKAFSAGVAELGPRWKEQQERPPNIVWQFLAWIYLTVRRAREALERIAKEAAAEKR